MKSVSLVFFLCFCSYSISISDKCLSYDLIDKYNQYISPTSSHSHSSSSHSSLRSSSSSSPSRWAILTLIRQQDYHQNKKRNSALATALSPYSTSHNLTFLFFSEDTFTSREINEWKEQFRSVGEVQLIDVSSKGYNFPPEEGKSRYGYKWMCKFFSVDIYEYLVQYDYYLRLDSDNILEISPSPPASGSSSDTGVGSGTGSGSSSELILSYDLMKYVEENGIEYGYLLRKYDPHQETQQTLPQFISSYLENCRIIPTIPSPSLSILFNFYNNFHVGKVSFFLSPPVRHFLLMANHTGKLYE